jgi:hypothetical protein
MKIGLSYSRCVRDIVDGVVDINDILVIVSRTDFDPHDDKQWQSIWQGYGGSSDGNMMRGYGLKGNQECKWDYEITDHEAVQHAHYGPEQHYGWHVDNFPLAGLPLERKVTVICLLSDPSEFEAGELQLRLYSEYTAPLVKGSVIAFPSILEHRVIPVTSGIRYSATMWFNGPRFR